MAKRTISLLEQAAKARRLAKGIPDDEIAQRLLELAAEYEAPAKEDEKQRDDKPTRHGITVQNPSGHARHWVFAASCHTPHRRHLLPERPQAHLRPEARPWRLPRDRGVVLRTIECWWSAVNSGAFSHLVSRAIPSDGQQRFGL